VTTIEQRQEFIGGYIAAALDQAWQEGEAGRSAADFTDLDWEARKQLVRRASGFLRSFRYSLTACTQLRPWGGGLPPAWEDLGYMLWQTHNGQEGYAVNRMSSLGTHLVAQARLIGEVRLARQWAYTWVSHRPKLALFEVVTSGG